jgi:hypothetical protein
MRELVDVTNIEEHRTSNIKIAVSPLAEFYKNITQLSTRL